MASIVKQKNGYRAQVCVKGRCDSSSFRTKREAESWAFHREEELRKPKTISEGKTLAFAHDFTLQINAVNITAATYHRAS